MEIIAEEIIKISDKTLDIDVRNEKIKVEYSGDNTLFVDEANFQFTPFHKALKNMYFWYLGHKSEISPLCFEY